MGFGTYAGVRDSNNVRLEMAHGLRDIIVIWLERCALTGLVRRITDFRFLVRNRGNKECGVLKNLIWQKFTEKLFKWS